MSISGSQQAYKQARAGIMRSGTSRSDYFTSRILIVLINGTDRTGYVDKGSVQIVDNAKDQQDTCTVEVTGMVTAPTVGQALVIASGANDNVIFSGTIVSAEQPSIARAAVDRWVLSAIDKTWLFTRRLVTGSYASQAADVLVRTLISSFTSGFTTLRVKAGAPTIEAMTFTGERMGDAMTRIANAAGWTWYLDQTGDVHFMDSETTAVPADLTTANRTYWNLNWRPTIEQIRTRVIVQGGGSQTTDPVAAGATTIPVYECGWYPDAAGQLMAGGQVLAYTGRTAASGPGDLTGVGNLTLPLLAGDSVNLWVVRNDTVAQGVLATAEGGDGIHEYLITDGRLGYDACVARGDAELELSSMTENTGSYETSDKRTRSGKTLTVNLPARGISSQAITIQSVTRSYAAPTRWQFRVTFSRLRRDYFTILRSLERAS